MFLCVSVEAQFESLNINPSSLLIASLSYTLNGLPGPCPCRLNYGKVIRTNSEVLFWKTSRCFHQIYPSF